jgi:5-methyltetrahydropteroyltriglutamate--homocysteine methyltransferase
VLGLMSTKVRDLESKEELRRRVDDAAKVVGIERLGLCPQCGFATAYHYDRLTIDDQERKLARLVEVANDIWG